MNLGKSDPSQPHIDDKKASVLFTHTDLSIIRILMQSGINVALQNASKHKDVSMVDMLCMKVSYDLLVEQIDKAQETLSRNFANQAIKDIQCKSN